MMNVILYANRIRPLRILFLFLLLFPPISGSIPAYTKSILAPKKSLRFDRLTRKDGLSYDMVTAFLQDDIGYLWIGTYDGLNRYDGVHFTVYRSNPADSSTLSSNQIACCVQSASGSLFIATYTNGLNQYLYEEDRFVRIPPDPQNPDGYEGLITTKLLRDSKNRLWMTTDNGLFEIGENPVRFKRHIIACENIATTFSNHKINTLAEDPEGNLWLDVSVEGDVPDGFVCYNPDTHEAAWRGNGNVTSLAVDRNGVLWGGTWGKGILRFDPRQETSEFLVDRKDALSERVGRIIKDVMVGRDGLVWVANWEKGLLRIDPDTYSFWSEPAKPWLSSGLTDASLNCLYRDREGTIWIGTLHHGINYTNPLKYQFNHFTHDPSDPESLSEYFCYCLQEDREGILWVGVQGGGLNRYDPRTGTFTAFKLDPQQSGTRGVDTVISLEEDRDGTLWVGSHLSGLFTFDRQTQRFAPFHFPTLPEGSADVIRDIHCDRNNRLWVCEETKGLLEIDLASSTYRHYTDREESPYRLSSSETRAIREDAKGRLWLATNSGGLNRIDPSSGTVRIFQHNARDERTLCSSALVDLAIDAQDRLWVGTATGLDLYDEANDCFVHAIAGDEYICGIEPDKYGDLWISTRNGLIHFDPRSMTILKRYLPHDGVQEYTFHERAHYQDKNGLLYFGGSNGFNQFDPSWLQNTPSLPLMPVVVTRIETDRKTIHYPQSQKSSITLPYGKANIAFHYAGLSFFNSRRNQIEYRLLGYDGDWISGDDSRIARYTNLPPGTFTFCAIGGNAQGVWNRDGVRLPVVVLSPFWRKPWFVISSVASMFLIAYSIHRLRISIIRRKNIRLEKLIKKRTQELLASEERIFHLQKIEAVARLTGGLAHNINNMLTGIFGNLFFIKRSAEKSMKPYIESLEEASNRISDLVKNMMRFSQDTAIDLKETEILPIATNVHRFMEEKSDRRIRIEFRRDDFIPPVLADSFQLYSAILNLCINAAEAIESLLNNPQFSNRHSDSFFIQLSVQTLSSASLPESAIEQVGGQSKQYVVILIQDNGIGIQTDQKEYLFEPFHSTKKTVGAGMGLASSYGIVTQFGGTIDFESEYGRGSTFRIILPTIEK